MSQSAPPAPDYTQAAQEQGQQSQQLAAQQTAADRPNQTTPWGSSTWNSTAGIDPATGAPTTLWNQNVTLNPAEQATLTAQQGGQTEMAQAGQRYGANAGSLFNPINANGVQGAGISQGAEDAAWNQFENLNEPIFGQQTSQLGTQLSDQGLHPGEAAYNNATSNLAAQQNTARSGASSQAFLTGLEGGQTLQQEQLSQLAAQEGAQTQGANLFNGLTNGTQISNPFSTGVPGASSGQAPNLLGAAQSQGQSMLDQYNTQVGQQNSTESTIGSLASMAALYAL